MGPIKRSDGTGVGRPEELETRRMMRSVKHDPGQTVLQPEAIVAIRTAALNGDTAGVVERDGVIQASDAPVAPAVHAAAAVGVVASPMTQSPVVPETPAVAPDRLQALVEKAKARLGGVQREAAEKHIQPGKPGAAKNEAPRYKPDPDEGRKDEEGQRTKDKYFPDYSSGRDALKKLKASLMLKASKIARAMRSTKDTKAFMRMKEIKAEIYSEITKLAGVAEDLRMKQVSYPPEKDVGRQEGEGPRSKDKFMGPDVNPINKQLEKMWGSVGGIPKSAMPNTVKSLTMAMDKEENPFAKAEDEGKDPKSKEKEMGGNDMKPLPKDKDADERKDAPKGKGKGSKDQISNLNNSIKELKDKDTEFEKEIDALTDAVEDLGGTVSKDKDKEEGKKPPFGKDRAGKGPAVMAPGDKEPAAKPPTGEKPPLAIEEILGNPRAKSRIGREKIAARRRAWFEKRRTAMCKKPHGKDKMKDEEKDKKEKKEKKALINNTLGLTADLTREASKLKSYWTVYDAEKKAILKFTARQAYGSKTFEQWDKFSSRDYGKFLLARIRSEGVKKVAALFEGVTPIMTKEAMRIEIRAKGKGGAPALTKKITNMSDYYAKAYGDKGYAGKLVKKRTSAKPHTQTKKKAEIEDEKIVVALNSELEAENSRLRDQLVVQKAETEKTAEGKIKAEAIAADKDLNERLRQRAAKAMHLATRMAAKGLIKSSEEDPEGFDKNVEDMTVMDDLGYATMETMVEESVIKHVEETEKAALAKPTIIRTGGLDAAPATPVLELSMKDKLEGLWRQPKAPTQNQ